MFQMLCLYRAANATKIAKNCYFPKMINNISLPEIIDYLNASQTTMVVLSRNLFMDIFVIHNFLLTK